MLTGHKKSLEVVWRSFGGQLVAPNSNLISVIDSSSKITYKKTYYINRVKRLMFSGH